MMFNRAQLKLAETVLVEQELDWLVDVHRRIVLDECPVVRSVTSDPD